MRFWKVFFIILVCFSLVGLVVFLAERYYFKFTSVNQLKSELPTVTTSPLPNTVEYSLEVVASNLQVPWSFVFTSPERMIITERPGRMRVLENGVLAPEPIRVFSEVSSQAEEGLMGMVLDPNYAQNQYLYVCLAYENEGALFDKVVRVTDKGNSLTDDMEILDKIPAAKFHAGCRLRFGADEKLYISTGDATEKNLAQDWQSLAGKILRINADGSIPLDNPVANSPVYSLGHRNPQGFDWHPVNGALIATEHGPSGNDGPGGGDEINHITPGSNYGWPVVSHDKSQAGMVDPLVTFTPAIAPASGMFYRGSVFPQFTNNYFVGLLRGEGILRVIFDDSTDAKILSYEKLKDISVGRVRDIVEGPDGLIYFSTSNRDGRGKATADDDRIFRLVPKME